MRKLSRWAKSHPITARLLIILCRFMLLVLAWFLGKQAALTVTDLSPLWLLFFTLLFVVVCWVYPKSATAANYAWRKRCDLTITALSFLMVVCLTVQLQQPARLYQSVQATVPVADSSYREPKAEQLLKQFENGEKTTFTRKEKRIIRREFNHQLVRYGKAMVTGKKEIQQSAGIIILTCIAAVGLFFLVASLACTLSCNGSEAAAVVVLLFGTAAIIWGAVAIIKSKNKKKAKAVP